MKKKIKKYKTYEVDFYVEDVDSVKVRASNAWGARRAVIREYGCDRTDIVRVTRRKK